MVVVAYVATTTAMVVVKEARSWPSFLGEQIMLLLLGGRRETLRLPWPKAGEQVNDLEKLRRKCALG